MADLGDGEVESGPIKGLMGGLVDVVGVCSYQ